MLELPPHLSFYVEIAVFLVFAAILRALVWVPIQNLLAERANRTAGTEADAARLREEARTLEVQLDAALEEARLAGSGAGEQVRRDAEAAERELLAEARAEAAHVLDEVRRRVASETREARAALQGQAATLAALAAEKILGRPVTP